jgi:hypothetical protein
MINSNLEFLQDSKETLSYKQKESFDSHLIGWLSGVVSKKDWDEAVTAAKEYVQRPRRKTSFHIPTAQEVEARSRVLGPMHEADLDRSAQ